MSEDAKKREGEPSSRAGFPAYSGIVEGAYRCAWVNRDGRRSTRGARQSVVRADGPRKGRIREHGDSRTTPDAVATRMGGRGSRKGQCGL
jgi:hypothetical protein